MQFNVNNAPFLCLLRLRPKPINNPKRRPLPDMATELARSSQTFYDTNKNNHRLLVCTWHAWCRHPRNETRRLIPRHGTEPGTRNNRSRPAGLHIRPLNQKRSSSSMHVSSSNAKTTSQTKANHKKDRTTYTAIKP